MSISFNSTFGSTTVPEPIRQVVFLYKIPDGMRCSFKTLLSTTIVCPAFTPP